VTDQFETAAIRERVLGSWVAAPVRFREDANLEEDLVLGGYRDRVIVELAQNAADAAARVGLPGRLRLTLANSSPEGPTLTAANTGAPLDASGVLSLSTLRASAKREETSGDAGPVVGRFGVGFAAVLAVSDAPAVLSRAGGGVRFSALEAREAVRLAAEQNAELASELDRRGGRVPALRLPYAAEGAPPWGYDTAVSLPLRDEAAVDLVRRLLTELDDTLLLALPQLSEIVVDLGGEAGVRTLTADRSVPGECVVADGARTTRWRLAEARGGLDRELLADRPVEERIRPYWSLTWAVPVDEDGGPRRLRTAPVLHAPTPTDEPLGLPALLLASFPLEVTRRRVAPGPLADFLLARAAEAYADLVTTWPTRTPVLLRLVPGPMGEGAIDAELRRHIAALLPDAAFLPAANADPAPLRPRDAVVIDPCDAALVAAVRDVLPGLLPAGWERDQVAATALGVRRLGAGELAEALSGLDRDPSWWGALYAAMYGVFGQDPDTSETLAVLPVPLADGRTVRGARGSLLPVAELDASFAAALRPLGLRIVHPNALSGSSGAESLLERLGARPAHPRVLLDDPSVRGAIAASRDPLRQQDVNDGPGDGSRDDPATLAEAVLSLVRAAEPGPRERFDLADLLLPNDRGGYSPAGELLLPSSPLAEVVDPEAFGFVDEGWVGRWGTEVLRAVGVLDSLALVRAENVLLDIDALDEDLLDLDGIEEWIGMARSAIDRSGQGAAPVTTEFVGVRDLDLITRWPRALELLAGPGLRAAIARPVRVLTDDGRPVDLPSYTSWWLSRHPVLDGRRPADLSTTGGGLLAGLYEQAPADKDPEFQVRLGVRTTLDALLAAPGGPDELLERLADPERPVGASQLAALYDALSEVSPEHLDPPTTLRAWQDGELVVIEAAEVVVIDAPDLLPLLDGRPYLVVRAHNAAPLADLLEIDLVSEAIPGAVTSEGQPETVPEEIRALLPSCPDTYIEHDELILDDEYEVAWRVIDGVPHASTFDGMARALAWVSGRWDRRHLIAALLAEPERAEELTEETRFE